MHNKNALHAALPWSRRRFLRVVGTSVAAMPLFSACSGAPSAESPRGSMDVNMLRSAGADNELETTTRCLGAPLPGRRVARVGTTHAIRWGVQRESETAVFLSQLDTVAVCGHSTCDCGPLRQMSRQNGPCAVASATGGCEVGSGECCLCAEATATVAVCSNNLCDCGASVMTKVGAPCTVTSLQGRCEVSSGECCLCASK